LSKSVGEVPQQNLTSKENAAIIAALLEVEVKKEKKVARQVAALQIVSMLIGASIAYSINGTPQFAIAVLSGGGVSFLNGSLLAWRMYRAALYPAHDAHQQLHLMYLYAAERFLVVIALLGLCLAALRLSPFAVLSGFVMGQAVLLTARLFLSKFKTEIVTKNV
jgi:hypothetical protein